MELTKKTVPSSAVQTQHLNEMTTMTETWPCLRFAFLQLVVVYCLTVNEKYNINPKASSSINKTDFSDRPNTNEKKVWYVLKCLSLGRVGHPAKGLFSP